MFCMIENEAPVPVIAMSMSIMDVGPPAWNIFSVGTVCWSSWI